MASFTRKAIMDSFMKLVDQRPISKITIKDIVEDCGVNRNTFYYHFADIPALIEAIVHDQAEELIRNHSTITTIEDALNVAVDSILQHRRAALHIFNSVSRDVYERYLMQICQDAVEKCFDAIIGERRVSPAGSGNPDSILSCLVLRPGNRLAGSWSEGRYPPHPHPHVRAA